MNPQAAESRATRAGDELRHEVAHRIGEQREHQRADDVPAGDVQILEAAREEWRQKLDDRQHERQHDEHIDYQREFGPFERLAETRQHQYPARQDDREIP